MEFNAGAIYGLLEFYSKREWKVENMSVVRGGVSDGFHLK